jgi:heat shock protein HslJ
MDVRIRSAELLFLIPLLVACAAPTPSPTPTSEPFDADGDWLLESGVVNGAAIPIVADNPITFSVDGTEVGGQSACNFYGGRIELAESQIRLVQTSSTAMLCGEPDGEVMRSEAAFQAAIGEVRAAHAEADKLTLFGQAVELVFTRQAPIPIAELVGTDWILESVVDGDVAAVAIGEPATLRLDQDGTFHGSTGCRTFTGTWVKAQGRVTATQTNMFGECPGGLGGQDGLVAEGLSGSIPTIDGDRLTLRRNGGTALVYRRGPEWFQRADIV